MDFLLHFGPSHYNDLFRCALPYFAGDGDASEFVKKYLENYDEVHVYYTCLDVAFDKGDAMVTIADVLEDFQKEHGYVRYSYLRRDKTRHYKDERGIKMGEMLCIVKFYR